MMDKKTIERIRKNPDYQELVTKRSGFAWKLAIAMLVVYYAFILTIAFSPETLGIPIGEGVITIGIPVGIFIIVFAFLLTGIYTWRANSTYDELERKVKAELKEEIGV
jgi:uncharacterized membrane protein (DUF485 family)